MPSRAPAAEEALPGALVPLWSEDAGKAVMGPVAVGERVVVTQASNRLLTARDRATGQRLWMTRLSGPGASGPLFTAQRVFSASTDPEGQVAAFDLSSGHRRWRRRVGPVQGTLAMDAGLVFAATRRGRLVALDATNGQIEWTKEFGSPLRSGVTVVGPSIAVSTDDSLFLVDKQRGEVVTARSTDATVTSSPAVVPRMLVTSSPAGIITAYATPSLDRLWQRHVGAPVFGSVAIARDTVFAADLGGRLWRIPLDDPARAVFDSIGSPMRTTPTPVRNGVVIVTVAGLVLLYDSDPSRPLWRAELDGPIDEPAVVYQGMVFIADGGGRVHVWEEGQEGKGGQQGPQDHDGQEREESQ